MRCFLAAVVLLFSALIAQGADWPAYMHDNARSGVTDETLALPLREQWVYRAPAAPRPAWPDPQLNDERHKMKFDDAFYTVASGDTVFFASSVDHQVRAIDAATGQIRWSFFTGAPVRLAPTLARGKIFFGSDDGIVYCLDAANGKLIWQFSAAPEPRRVIGNGSIISLWPVRTGVLVDGDRLYFAAGIFPYHAPSLVCLETDTGKVVPWIGKTEKAWLDLSPQGYLVRTSRGLLVPCGRTMPFLANLESGNPLFKISTKDRQETGGAAGSYGLSIDNTFYIGTQGSLYGFDSETGTLNTQWLGVQKLVASNDTCYVINSTLNPRYKKAAKDATFLGVTAFDRIAQNKIGMPATQPSGVRWRYEHPDPASLILAGSHIILGCENEVVMLDAKSGKEVWKAPVLGDAVGLSVANGRLWVSTTRGMIHCFSIAPPSPVVAQGPVFTPAAQALELVEKVIETTSQRRGYAVVTGPQAVDVAVELARQSDLNITCIETNDEKLQTSRAKIESLKIYGSRVTVSLAEAGRMPYPDFAANLVLKLDAATDQKSIEELVRILKPCGGVLLAASGDAALFSSFEKAGALKHEISVAKTKWTQLVRGTLEGSGWWTHAYGDAGGSGSSGDRRIANGNLAVLWFGEPGAGEAMERHQRIMSPLAINGRIFFQGWGASERKSNIICFDAYNGLRYWEHDSPGSVRLRLPAVAGNLVCSEEHLYVVAGSKCEKIDVMTGKTTAVFETPKNEDGVAPLWGYLAYANGLIIGSTTTGAKVTAEMRSSAMHGIDNIGMRFSDSVFALDAASGKLLWTRRGKEIRDSMIVLGNNRVFYAENTGDPTVLPARSPDGGLFYHKSDDGTPDKAVDRLGKIVELPPTLPLMRWVRAIDAASGKIVWEKEVNFADCGIWGVSASTREAAGYRELQALCKNDVLLFAAAFNQHDSANPNDLRLRKAIALSPNDGSVIWEKPVGNLNRPIILRDALLAGNVMRDLRTGDPLQKHDMKTGKSVPWTVLNGGACGTPSASDGVVFYRLGSTAWRSIDDGTGSRFGGIRPGCFTNILPVGGVVVQPEASSGCTCNFSVQCTITFAPR